MDGNVYVGSISLFADMQQAVKTLLEAEAYPGTSVVLCYSPCIEHGYDMSKAIQQAKLAVDSGYWSLYRWNPSLLDEGRNPFVLDSKKLKVELKEMMKNENRFSSLSRSTPHVAKKLQDALDRHVKV